MRGESGLWSRLVHLGLALLGLGLAGCGKHFLLVEYAEQPLRPISVVEVQLTPQTAATVVESVGVLYPAQCHFAELPEASSPCAVWSRALSHAFTESGYRVVPVSSMAEAFRQHATVQGAAQQLGVSLVVSVNRADADDSALRVARLAYFESNAAGERLSPVVPGADVQAWATRYLTERNRRPGAEQLELTLDVTATQPATGAVVWSFSGTKLFSLQPYMKVSMLIRGNESKYRPVLPSVRTSPLYSPVRAAERNTVLNRGVALLAAEAVAGFRESQSP